MIDNDLKDITKIKTDLNDAKNNIDFYKEELKRRIL